MYLYYLYHPDLPKPQRLRYDPIGWDSLGKTMDRDPETHGIFFKYSVKLSFIKDGRSFLQYFNEKYGPDQDPGVTITIFKKNKSTRHFDRDFEGKVNMMSLRVTETKAEVNIEQTGFVQKVKNLKSIKVDMRSALSAGGKTITPQSTINTILHSKTIRYTQRLGFVDTDDANVVDTGLPDQDIHTPPFVTTIDEIEEANDVLTLSKDAILLSTEGIDFTGSRFFRVRGELTISTDQAAQGIEVFIGKSSGVTTTQLIVHSEDVVGVSSHKFVFDVTIELFPGAAEAFKYQEIQINVTTAEVGDPSPVFTYSLDSFVEITEDTTAPESQCTGMMIHEVWAGVIQYITDLSGRFKSDHYGRTDSSPAYAADGAGSLRMRTNGKLIRGFPFPENGIFANLEDLLKTCRAIDGVGMGIEKINGNETVVVEPLSYFYKASRSIQIPWVKDIEMFIDEKEYANELIAGFDNWNNEQLNNLDEFNAPRQFILPITQTKNTKDLKARDITAGYTIESVRRDSYEIGSNKDNDRDNDDFLIQMRRDSGNFVPVKDEGFEEVNGLFDSTTSYNLDLSPMRCIVRNGSWVRTGLYKKDDKSIGPGTGPGNIEMTTRKTGETELLSEKEIAVSRLSKSLFLPIGYKFKAPITREQQEILEAQPYDYIEFARDNKNWKRAHIIKTEFDPKSELTTFTVRRANI